MSALGQKQTSRHLQLMSALPPKADIKLVSVHCGTFMQQHLPFFGLHTLAKLPHCKLSPPHLSWLLAAPACGGIDSNISVADSVTISIRMIWLPSPFKPLVITPPSALHPLRFRG